MNNTRGFATMYIILAVLLVGGFGYAIVQRDVLKSFFEKGDTPTQQQFGTLIDSTVQMPDDGQEAKTYNPTKEYVAGDTAIQSAPIYQAKVLSPKQPEFTLTAKQAVTFRWDPSSAKEPVSYRLKVWQLMQGQNGAAAMRSNEPIVTRDVDTVSEVTIDSIYTGPCRPPYLCDYVWSVETISKAAPAAGTSLEGTAAADGTTGASTETKVQ